MSSGCFSLPLSCDPFIGGFLHPRGVSSQVLGFVLLNPQAWLMFREVPSLAVWEWEEKVAQTVLLLAEANLSPTSPCETSLASQVGGMLGWAMLDFTQT